jgi:hypothetical protein
MDGTVSQYIEAFCRGNLGGAKTEGLLGRVIRGKIPADFETLSDDPRRKLVLLTDPDGLAALPGLSGFSILMRIGWEPGYAAQKIQEGYKLKLAVFREGGPAQLATWDGIVETTCQAYVGIGNRLRRHLETLMTVPFDVFERQYGCDMPAVDHEGESHPMFMTHERFLQSADTAANARAFLYFTAYLREQYRGDGYTYDSNGVRGVKEYIAPNCRLAELADCEVVDFPVELPAAV